MCFDVHFAETCLCLCRLLQRPADLYAAAAQAGLTAARADAHAAGAALEHMPMGLRRIAGQAAQILSSHVSHVLYNVPQLRAMTALMHDGASVSELKS